MRSAISGVCQVSEVQMLRTMYTGSCVQDDKKCLGLWKRELADGSTLNKETLPDCTHQLLDHTGFCLGYTKAMSMCMHTCFRNNLTIRKRISSAL